MKVKNDCGLCGNPLQLNDPGGICPNCLMGHAFPNRTNRTTMDASGSSYGRAEDLVGRFPNLEILHLIGHGGMGAVYLARQTNLGRMVALKVLSPRLGNDPEFTERFTREARTLAKLSHPNIVTVFDYGKTESLNYLLMEYVDGINLRDAIQAGKLTPEESLAIVPQICDALQYAHNEGVIHRDIKPENILLDNKGRVKIADFGLAKLLQPNQNEFSLTGTQQVLGTRNYMAPEQIEKPDVVDHRADIYSLGVVFYELLTGELPIGRFAVPSEKAAVTNRLDDVVMRTLEKEPARRFQQASDVRTAVESLGGHNSMPLPDTETAPPRPESMATLPFSISELFHGFAAAHGIAHLYANRLELEYEVVDEVLGEFKSSAKQVSVPLRSVVSVRFVKGIFSDRIEFQTDRLEAAKDVPNSSRGRFSLGTKRADIELSRRFVDQVDRIRLGAMAGPQNEFRQQAPAPSDFRSPVPPRKSNVFRFGDQPSLSREEVIDKLKVPYFGFLAIGWIHLLLAIRGFLRQGAWQKLESFDTSLLPGAEISFYLPRLNTISFNNVMMLMVGVLLLCIASRLRRPRNYRFVFAALIVVMVSPVHVAYVLTFILAIWALVVLSDNRCRAVYLAAGDRRPQGQRPAAHFVSVMLITMVAFVSLVAAASFTYLLLGYDGASVKSPVPPQPVVQTREADRVTRPAAESDSNTEADSAQNPGPDNDSKTDSSSNEPGELSDSEIAE